MNFIKSTTIGLSSFLLGILLYIVVSIFIIFSTIGNANYFKATLRTTGFYKNIVANTLNLTVSEGSIKSDLPGSISDLRVLSPIIEQVITPNTIQLVVEPIIDGFEGWLKNKYSQPEFKVNTAQEHNLLIDKIAEYLLNQTTKLPLCTSRAQIQIPFNPLTAVCRPSTNIDKKDFINASTNFVDTMPVFNGQPISMKTFDPNNNLNKNVIWKNAPKYYKLLNYSRYICAFLIFLFCIIIFVLSDNRFLALKNIGKTFVSSAFFLMLFGLLFIFYFGKHTLGIGASASHNQQAFVESIISPISQHLSHSFGIYYLWFSLVYAFIGVILFLLGRHYLNKNKITDPMHLPHQ